MESDLRKWQQQLISEIETEDKLICELQLKRNANSKKLKHVDELLGISTNTDEVRGLWTREKRATEFLDECERILRASSEPVHVNDLIQRLLDGGIPIPGMGTAANVISRLWRSPRFKRVGCGTYIPC